MEITVGATLMPLERLANGVYNEIVPLAQLLVHPEYLLAPRPEYNVCIMRLQAKIGSITAPASELANLRASVERVSSEFHDAIITFLSAWLAISSSALEEVSRTRLLDTSYTLDPAPPTTPTSPTILL